MDITIIGGGLSLMSQAKLQDEKIQHLKKQGCLNPHPESVKDPLFAHSDFFDARDLVQTKYEMVRRARIEKQSVSHSAKTFGFSRPAFYQAQALLDQGGLAALVPQKPGPRRSHKLNTEVIEFLQQRLSKNPALRSQDLSGLVLEHFGRKVHPRSVERALARQEKKRR